MESAANWDGVKATGNHSFVCSCVLPGCRLPTTNHRTPENMNEEIKPTTTEIEAVAQQAWGASLVETDEERRARLKRPVGILDAVIIKQACPDIPDDFIHRMMFGGR